MLTYPSYNNRKNCPVSSIPPALPSISFVSDNRQDALSLFVSKTPIEGLYTLNARITHKIPAVNGLASRLLGQPPQESSWGNPQLIQNIEVHFLDKSRINLGCGSLKEATDLLRVISRNCWTKHAQLQHIGNTVVIKELKK